MDPKKISMAQFFLGLALAIGAGVLMLMDVWPLTTRIVMGIAGITLIASAKFGIMR